MPSEETRIRQALQHIERIKEGTYPVAMGQRDSFRIEERPWQEVPERSKLAILQDAVDWAGVSNRDQGHILLTQIDPGKITDAQRNRLIDMAAVESGYQEMLDEKSTVAPARHRELER